MSFAQTLPVSRSGHPLAWLSLLCLALPCLAGGPAPKPAKPQPAPDSYEAFQIIPERNIFNPTYRGPHKTAVEKPQPKVDAFTLVGTMSYEKGEFAFFDGTAPEFKKAVKVGEEIAGYTLTQIATNEVTLKTGDEEMEFPLGKQLRRENEGAWKLVKMKGTFTAPILPENETHTVVASTSGSGNRDDAEMSDKRSRKLSRFSEEDVARIKELKESGDSKALKEFIVEQARAMGRPEKLSKFDKRAMKAQ